MEAEKVLEMDGGDGYTIMWMYLIPLICTLKNYQNGKFYVMYILLQEKRKYFIFTANLPFPALLSPLYTSGIIYLQPKNFV